jgi:hypothetical protein
MVQRSLFDPPPPAQASGAAAVAAFDAPEKVEVARQRGMDRSEQNACPEWKEQAVIALSRVATLGAPFTADHVWLVLEQDGVAMPHTPAALGPIFLRAAKQGLIAKTGRLVRTKFARRHRDLTEWISRPGVRVTNAGGG